MFRSLILWVYWISGLTFVGWQVYHDEIIKAMIYLLILIVVHIILFGMVWRSNKERNRESSSFFHLLDCDCGDLDCDGGGGGGFDGGGFGGGD